MSMRIFWEELQRLGACVQSATARKLSQQSFLFVIPVSKVCTTKIVYTTKAEEK
jgi:hypothetical protein